jgi:hypothetical protein
MVLLGYIDPGTGSFLLQLLIGGLLGGLATLKLSWARLRAFVRPSSHRSGEDK